MAEAPLDGPRLEPASGGPATGLVVLLHGYAATGDQLIPLGRALQRVLPDVACVAPHGPLELLGPNLRAWAELRIPFDEEHLYKGTVATAPLVQRFIDDERDQLGLTDAEVALVGFSQGAVTALHVGLRRPEPVATIVSYSGFIAGRRHLDEITARPPVTLIHGDRDWVVPIMAMELTAEALREADVPVETVVVQGLGHIIDAEGMDAGAEALQQALGGMEP